MPKISPKIREAVMKGYGYKCAKCGSTYDLTLDHIIPKSLGGRTVKKNLQVLCQVHNNLKNDKTVHYQPGYYRRERIQ